MVDFAHALAGAVEGGAKAVGDIATGQIETNRRLDLARELAAMEEAKQQRALAAAEAMRREGVLWGTTGPGGAAALDLAKRQGAQATELAVDQLRQSGPIAAGNAGLIVTAQEAAKGFELSPGQQKFNADGSLKAENKRLTGAEVSGQLSREGLRGTAGTAKRDDHWSDKEWFRYKKPEETLISVTDEISGKARKLDALERTWNDTYAALRAQGGFSPYEANEAASDFTKGVRDKANARLEAARKADPKTRLTIDEAIASVQRDLQAALARTQPGGATAAQSNPAVTVGPTPFRDGPPAAAPAALLSAAPPPAAAPVAARPVVAPAPGASMEARANQETREINDLKRTAYSPDVQAWIDARDAAAARERAAQGERDRAAELRRAQERTAGLLQLR